MVHILVSAPPRQIVVLRLESIHVTVNGWGYFWLHPTSTNGIGQWVYISSNENTSWVTRTNSSQGGVAMVVHWWSLESAPVRKT